MNTPLPPNGPVSEATAKSQAPGTIWPVADYTTGTYNSQPYSNLGFPGLRMVIDVNNVNTTGTLDVKLQTKDPITGTWYDVPESSITQITATGQVIYQLYPDVEEDGAAGVSSVSCYLPAIFRIVAIVGTATVNFSLYAEHLC